MRLNVTQWPSRRWARSEVLGAVVGRLVRTAVPILLGCPAFSLEELRGLGAAAAATGGVALYHVDGVTPEAGMWKGAATEELPSLDITPKDLEEQARRAAPGGEVELVVLGCPHLNLDELIEVANWLDGRTVKEDVEFWIFSGHSTLTEAQRLGVHKTLEDAGARLFSGTCMVVSPSMTRFSDVLTDSMKAWHYLPTMIGSRAASLSRRSCVEAAVAGIGGALTMEGLA